MYQVPALVLDFTTDGVCKTASALGFGQFRTAKSASQAHFGTFHSLNARV